MKLICSFNTKGGVGKTTTLQQLILPAAHEIKAGRPLIYIDTDKMNASSRFIENSKYVDEIVRHPISEKESIAKLIDLITIRLNNNEIILLDPPAGDSSENILDVLYAFDTHCFVFIPTLSYVMDQDNTAKSKKKLSKYNIPHALIYNKQSDCDDENDEICFESVAAVIDFANNQKKTILELAEVDINNLSLHEKSFINLIKKKYTPQIKRQLPKVTELLS